jgi:hypothetical protein
MTITGPERKRLPCRRGRRTGAALFAALLAFAGGGGLPAAATTERLVVDPHSGLAISGFDPVAYFTERKALIGDGEFEQAFAGAVWRFRNEGNEAAFAADPEVYMPRFGGYDPVGVARGVPVAGNPQFWVIRDERLYLFYSIEAKTEFLQGADRIIAIADSEWKSLQRYLAR